MAIIRNKILYVLDDNQSYIPFHTVNEEVFLTADISNNSLDYNMYYRAIMSPTSQMIMKLYLLNEDETIRMDVSDYVLNASVNFNYQQGQTRNCNFTLINNDGFWKANTIQRNMWRGTKFRLDVGLFYNGIAFWKRCGIYSPSNPSFDTEKDTVSVQMYDKFALLDGTLGGKQPYKIKIPVGTKLKTAIQMCLSMSKGNGTMYDNKMMLFPSKYESYTIPYTIDQNEDVSLGEIIIELANIISCDVCYNDYGNLVISEAVDSDYLNFYDSKPILWHYHENDLQYTNAQVNIDFQEFVNKVIVRGAIQDGKQFYGEAVNNNPLSQTNTLLNDTYTYQMTDNMIYSDKLCQDRAKYELKNQTMLKLQTKYKSLFIPHLLQNEVVKWDNKKLNIYNKRFVIKSISIDLSNMLMDISLCNVDEICL